MHGSETNYQLAPYATGLTASVFIQVRAVVAVYRLGLKHMHCSSAAYHVLFNVHDS
jgi:hypothetical protein